MSKMTKAFRTTVSLRPELLLGAEIDLALYVIKPGTRVRETGDLRFKAKILGVNDRSCGCVHISTDGGGFQAMCCDKHYNLEVTGYDIYGIKFAEG